MNYEEAAKEVINLTREMRKPHTQKHVDMISRGKAIMLSCIEKSGGVIMPSEIAKATGVSTARVAAFLNAAESKGYILRKSVENDRRKVQVVLTEAGFEKVSQEREKMLTKTTLFLEKLGEEDTEDLIRIMKKVQKIIKGDEFEN